MSPHSREIKPYDILQDTVDVHFEANVLKNLLFISLFPEY